MMEKEPWKAVGCCKACWFAKRNRCKCRCKGQHHQEGREKHIDEKSRVT